ncbi:MAG: DUF2520 domain-containing protein [Chloroflexota bacterium]|nr:DUF2520 domain-containing protein [Chloroflexota bacterium]
MMRERPFTVGFVGSGRAASGLARALHAVGWRVSSIAARSADRGAMLADGVGARWVWLDEWLDNALAADLTLIAVPDDAIAAVAHTLANRMSWQRRAVVHVSGATSVSALDPLRDAGARAGGLHPAYPFSADLSITPDLRGVTFAVETRDPALDPMLAALVESLGGQSLSLDDKARPLYHAALVFASNYPIVLIALAGRLLESIGAPPDAAKSALDALVGGMVDNVRREGAIAALPGPLVRGDIGTIAAHLDALRYHDPDTAQLYAHLAQAAYPLLQARGTPIDSLQRLFHKDISDAQDNP